MSPRRYRTDRRKAAMDETRRRIVEATVALHAEKGVAATTYALIAKRADVAVPTVYNHFPQLGDLLAACTGDVAARAPRLGPEIFAGAADTEARAAALVTATFAAYRFRAPWLRWGIHEAAFIPELRAIVDEARAKLGQLIALALAPTFGQRPPPSLCALWALLLDFSAWQRLTSDGRLSDDEAAAAVTDALLALIRSGGTAGSTDHLRPRRSPT
jgi:AcrR family transcriptional regulator